MITMEFLAENYACGRMYGRRGGRKKKVKTDE